MRHAWQSWDRLTRRGSTLNNAKRQGYLDSAGPGKFSINTVGENLVPGRYPWKRRVSQACFDQERGQEEGCCQEGREAQVGDRAFPTNLKGIAGT